MGKVANLSVFTPGGQPGAPNPSEGLAALRQNQTAFMETIGVMPPESLTIADGAISPTTAVCIVDTEGGAPADDLMIVNATLSDGSTLHDGMLILLSAKDNSRVVTVKNSDAPNGVKTVDGKDIALSPEWSLVLQYASGGWQQISVSAPLKPATETTLGGVKVGDGLTMGEDGTLSADLATAEAAGRVKASETAKAGAVPLGGADGTLGEGWLKKAMDAAAAAQKTADEAKRAAEKKPEITVLSTRKSAGGTENWTITGVDTTSLLYITHKTTTTSTSNQGVFIQGASGIADGPQSLQPPLSLYALSYTTPGGTESMAGNILILRPTDSTVVLNIRWMTANGALTAWQYK